MKNGCLNCNTPLKGRTDKKFCDNACKNEHNNKVARKSEKIINETNKALRKNRTVLKTLNPQGKTTVRIEQLKAMGFDFRFFTHTYTTNTKMTYKFCYEYGYLVVDDEKMLIVNWQEYMKADTLP